MTIDRTHRIHRTHRAALSLSAVALTGILGLSACVPSAEDQETETTTVDTPSAEATEATDAAEAPEETTAAAEDPENEDQPEDEQTEDQTDDDAEGADTEEDAAADTVELRGLDHLTPSHTESGTGPTTFDLEHPDGMDAPVLTGRTVTGASDEAEVTYTYFEGLRTDGQTYSIGAVDEGLTGMTLVDPYWMDARTTEVEVNTEDGVDWEFMVYPLDEIPTVSPGQSVEGSGAQVFRWTGGSAQEFRTTHGGESNFIVKTEGTTADAGTVDVPINDVGSGEGTLELSEDEVFVLVTARGPWEFIAQ